MSNNTFRCTGRIPSLSTAASTGPLREVFRRVFPLPRTNRQLSGGKGTAYLFPSTCFCYGVIILTKDRKKVKRFIEKLDCFLLYFRQISLFSPIRRRISIYRSYPGRRKARDQFQHMRTQQRKDPNQLRSISSALFRVVSVILVPPIIRASSRFRPSMSRGVTVV